MNNTKFKQATDYVWMLKNKTTGQIYPTYTYKNREAARKAVRSASGRFINYTPVKVSKTAATSKTSTKTKSKASNKGFGFWRVGSRSRFSR